MTTAKEIAAEIMRVTREVQTATRRAINPTAWEHERQRHKRQAIAGVNTLKQLTHKALELGVIDAVSAELTAAGFGT